MSRRCIDCGQRPQATRAGLCEECDRRWSERAGRVGEEPEPDPDREGQQSLTDY